MAQFNFSTLNGAVRLSGSIGLALAYEFLPLSMSTYGPPAITKLCHFSGGVTLLGVMLIGLSGPAPRSPYCSVLLIIALFLVAVALGNIVKEIAFALCAQLSNWAGFNFRRTGRTLGGTPFRDLRRSDGTWRHLERREREKLLSNGQLETAHAANGCLGERHALLHRLNTPSGSCRSRRAFDRRTGLPSPRSARTGAFLARRSRARFSRRA